MTKKYIVVDYKSGKSEEPVIAAEYERQDSAVQVFEKLKTANIKRSVVLFNTLTAVVENIAIIGEPIYLANAITFSRTFVRDKSILETVNDDAMKTFAAAVIGHIAGVLAGGPLPGVGGVILGHFIAPYYAFKGNAVAATSAAAGIWGSLAGGIVGFLVGGPVGAVIGGAAGGIGSGAGAGAIVKSATEPQKCKDCSGTGLVSYYAVCDKCKGYGYYR